MSKSDSVFVAVSGYYQSVDGAFTSLEDAKDFILSEVLCDVLEGDKYLSTLFDTRINEMVGGDIVNRFEVSAKGIDMFTGKVTNANQIIESLDIRCVTYL